MIIAYYFWVWCMSTLVFGLRNKESKTVAKHTIYHDNIDNHHNNCHMYLYYCPTLLVRLLPSIAQLTINGSSFAPRLRPPAFNLSQGGSLGHKSHVAYRSICDWDQNWIKWSKFFLGDDQGVKTNSEGPRSTDQHIRFKGGVAILLSFEPPSNQELQKHAIKWFSLIKILDPGCRCFYGWYVSDYPLWGYI